MTAAAIFRNFNHLAIRYNLTGRQMQLWLKVYEFLSSYKRQDVQLYTPMLLDMLDISISQFRRARQGLIDAGFLSIRQDTAQHTSYTLLLDGKEVAFGGGQEKCRSGSQNSGTGNPNFGPGSAQNSGKGNPSPTEEIAMFAITGAGAPRPDMKKECSCSQSSSGDIMATGAYHADLDAFTAQFADTALTGWLHQWADMRRKNSWSLTRWGLDVLLDKLKTLAEGNLQTMTAIVRQSVTRRWKGFYPLRTERKPSGEALRRMEAQERHTRPSHQKFQNEQRDLSFLER